MSYTWLRKFVDSSTNSTDVVSDNAVPELRTPTSPSEISNGIDRTNVQKWPS